MRRPLLACLFVCSVLAPSTTFALPLDMRLGALGVPANDPAASERFRLLTSELALALTPRTLHTGETLGMSGFEVGVDVTFVNFNVRRDYWQGVTERERRGGGTPNGTQTVTGFHFRKGLPFSFELDGHVNYLVSSSMFMVGGGLRYSFLEGYKWVPNISARAGVARLLAAEEIDMTNVTLDVALSKTFALAGIMTITPILGWGMIFVHANSTVLDATPLDQSDNTSMASGGSLYQMPTFSLGRNFHQKLFAGLRFHAYVFAFYYQFDLGLIRGGPILIQNTLKVGMDF